jgi:3-hydroxyacyl-[acyl-carrier-protein] dehydratase
MEITEVLTFPSDHPALEGHFPGDPIVPGALLLDAVLSTIERRTDLAIAGIASAKFFKPLRPGEAFAVTLRSHETQILAFSCEDGSGRIAAGTIRVRSSADA